MGETSRVRAAAVLLVLLGGTAAHAGGQFVGDQGPQGQQRSGAFVAKADDPSAVMLNPAGLARLSNLQLQLGANVMTMDLAFNRYGTYSNGEAYPTVEHKGGIQPLPYLAVTFPIGDRFTVGGGFFTPSGYGSREFPDNAVMSAGAPQRYDAVYSRSRVLSPSAAVAYQVSDKLSVGARFTWGIFNTHTKKYVQGLANEAEDPGTDSMTEVKTSDMFVPTAGVGVHYAAAESLEFGFVFNSPASIRAKGTAQTTLGPTLASVIPGGLNPVPDNMARCAPGGTAAALKACTDVNLPMNATLGARLIARGVDGKEMGDVELDVRWENWSKASDYKVTVDSLNSLTQTPIAPTMVRHGLQDVFSIRLGSTGRVPIGSRNLDIRAGVGYESAAAPVSWTRLDVDGSERYMATGGVGIEFGRFRVDLGIGYIATPARQVRDVSIPDTALINRVQPDIDVPLQGEPPHNPYNAGEYRTSYTTGSLGVTTWW